MNVRVGTQKTFRRSTRKANTGRHATSAAAPVSVTPPACRRAQVTALAERGEELRAQKVKDLKARIEAGTYPVDAAEVAKSIVRTEVARLLDGKRPNSGRKKL